MINWIYQNQEITEISDFPDDSYGFVYKITHLPKGKSYIGKKILYFTRKVKLGKKDLLQYEGVVGRRPSYKLAIKESDWKTYTGSNKELNDDIKNGTSYKKEILYYCRDKKQLAYSETKELFVREVLEHDEFYNSNISGKFYHKDVWYH